MQEKKDSVMRNLSYGSQPSDSVFPFFDEPEFEESDEPTVEDIRGLREIALSTLSSGERRVSAEFPSVTVNFDEEDDALRSELESTKNLLMQSKSSYENLQAEYQNFRRRTDRDKENEKFVAQRDIMLELLPILDNFSRAIEHANQCATQNCPCSDPIRSIISGVTMIARQIEATLAKRGCVRFDSLNKKFDPNFHEAIHRVVRDDVPPNTVIEVFLEGYMLDSRVLRAAHVIVSTRDEDMAVEERI